MAIGLAGLVAFVLIRDRGAAQYPGSVPVASHSIYKAGALEYRWDDSYLATDNFTAVYNWYSITFELGAESRAIERCILLEGTNAQFVAKRHISVLLCNTPNGQRIFVSRSTTFK